MAETKEDKTNSKTDTSNIEVTSGQENTKKKEALALVSRVCAQFRGTRDDHVAIQSALATLAE